MSTAGQANEAGSVFRVDAALVFAVHALAGVPVAAIDQLRNVVRIDFETRDATDDIVLQMSDGTTVYVAAKNDVRQGKSFTSVVEGWVSQARAGLATGDLLGLTYETSAQWVDHLASALSRMRAGQTATRRAELDALALLDGLVPPDLQKLVHDRVRLVHMPASPANGATRSLLDVMMDRVVASGDAAAATSVLSDHLHHLAGRAMGIDVRGLVEHLRSKGQEVLIGADGSPAARAAATAEAVREYLRRLRAEESTVNLSLMAEDLAPVVVPDLYGSLRVIDSLGEERSERKTKFDWLLRRRRRLLLVGQPGSGKSVAMREVAARCAGDPDAPFPIAVKLEDLVPTMHHRALTVSDMVARASELVDGIQSSLVADHMHEELKSGNAILILDGLDECRRDAGRMTDHLKAVIDGLHFDVGVVVSTRANAARPGMRLGLVRVDLQQPDKLTETMDEVLVRCAETRVGESEREQWLDVRRQWLREVREDQPGLIEVPQLALLVVLVVAKSDSLEVPKQRAALLHTAVKRSVERWDELSRFRDRGLEWAAELTPNMLLDGFVSLGSMLDNSAEPTRDTALRKLTVMLGRRWALADAKAEELAEQVLRFWDEHVSVFTLDGRDKLTSRSRVFSEVATAMWTMTCEREDLRAWAAEVVLFDESEGVLALALGLNEGLASLLLEAGDQSAEATYALAMAAGDGTVTLSEEDSARVVEQIEAHMVAINKGDAIMQRQASRDPSDFLTRVGQRDGTDSGPLLEALCGMPLTADLQHVRLQVIADCVADAGEKTAALAWAHLTDADVDGRSITDDEALRVQAAIDVEIPETERVFRESRRVVSFITGPRPPLGTSEVALRAIEHLDRLSPESPSRIYRIAQRSSMREGQGIESRLRAAGVETSAWAKPSLLWDLVRRFKDRDHELQFLRDIAALVDEVEKASTSGIGRWSKADLADLVQASGYPEVASGDFEVAFDLDSAELRQSWLRALCVAYGIDRQACAAQAAEMLAIQPADVNWPPDWPMLIVPPVADREVIGTDCLNQAEQVALLEALEAHSDWLAGSAAEVLVKLEPHWDTREHFARDRAGLTPWRAMLLDLVAILADPKSAELLDVAATSAMPMRRRAAASAIRADETLDPDGRVSEALARDPDLSVRLKSGDSTVPPERWSCTDCGHENDLDEADCTGCTTGTRPSHRVD